MSMHAMYCVSCHTWPAASLVKLSRLPSSTKAVLSLQYWIVFHFTMVVWYFPGGVFDWNPIHWWWRALDVAAAVRGLFTWFLNLRKRKWHNKIYLMVRIEYAFIVMIFSTLSMTSWLSKWARHVLGFERSKFRKVCNGWRKCSHIINRI